MCAKHTCRNTQFHTEHSCTYTYTHTNVHVHRHTYIHTYAHTHIHTHICTHIHTHTHIQTCACLFWFLLLSLVFAHFLLCPLDYLTLHCSALPCPALLDPALPYPIVFTVPAMARLLLVAALALACVAAVSAIPAKCDSPKQWFGTCALVSSFSLSLSLFIRNGFSSPTSSSSSRSKSSTAHWRNGEIISLFLFLYAAFVLEQSSTTFMCLQARFPSTKLIVASVEKFVVTTSTTRPTSMLLLSSLLQPLQTFLKYEKH